MINRITLLLLVILIVPHFNAQNESVVVQFPDKTRFSEHNYYDFSNNKIYSLDFNYQTPGIVIWDMWSMVPQDKIEVANMYMPEGGTVRFEKNEDSLFVSIHGHGTSYGDSPDTQLAISLTNHGVNTSKKVSDVAKLKMVRPFNFVSPNNSFDGSKGFQKVTGISIFEELKFVRNDSIHYLKIKSGNYVNELDYSTENNTFQRYDDYTKIEIRNIQDNNYYGHSIDTIFSYNTIAGAVHASGKYLALLQSDYSTLNVYQVEEDLTLGLIHAFTLELPDTSEFDLVFPADNDPSKITLVKMDCLELIDIEKREVKKVLFPAKSKVDGSIVFKRDTLNMDYYDRVLCVPLNDKYVEAFVYRSKNYYSYNDYHTGDRSVGSYLSYTDLIGFKNYALQYNKFIGVNGQYPLSFIYDIEEGKLVTIGSGKLYGKTSLPDVFTIVNQNSTKCEVYDAKRDRVVKKIDLTKVIKSFEFSMASNSYRYATMGNWHDTESPSIMNVFPFFRNNNEMSKSSFVSKMIVEKNNDNPAFHVTQLEVDPGRELANYTFINDLDKKHGFHVSGEYSYDYSEEYTFQENTAAYDIAQSSENEYYFLEALATNYHAEDSIAKEVGDDEFVFLSKYTDTTYVHKAIYPSFTHGQFSKHQDQLLLIGAKQIMALNYLTGDTIYYLKLKHEITNLSTFTSNEDYFIYIDSNYVLNQLDLQSKKEKELLKLPKAEILENGYYKYSYAFSQNGDYFGFEDFNDLKNMPPSYVISTITGEKVLTYQRPVGWVANSYDSDSTFNFLNFGYGMEMINNKGVPILLDEEDVETDNPSQQNANILHFVYVSTGDTAFSMMNVAGHWLTYLPEGYYFGEPAAVEGISFKKGNEVFPYSQFDHFYNRPDKVMQVVSDFFGVENGEAIEMLNKAYKKRLKKLDIGELNKLPDDVPTLKILNKGSLPYSARTIKLDIAIESKKNKLKDLTVLVNDVPVKWVNLLKSTSKKVNQSLTIDLMKGFNLIEVICRDNSGTPSMPQYLTVYGEGEDDEVKEDLYIVSIGAGEYQDSQFNLKYAAKDAQEFVHILNTSNRYEKVHNLTLVNEEFTVGKIAEIKAFLAPAKINDEIILFIAGHGVLDDNLDYFLATYDMDFLNPAKKGLSYEKLEAVLEGVKPLKKTLLLDACHSGEIDKDEVQLIAANHVEEGDVQFRAIGSSLAQKKGMQNVSELSKSIFNDLRIGTGATVISAAGGMEFAMERGDLKNGLFTYCFLDGLKSGEADLNQDGEIWLKEMQAYLQNKVFQLSLGKQQPTSRIVNNLMDYRIW